MSHIGVLGLQGDFAAHVKKLAELGVSAEVVRWPRQLAELDGLIIPGGFGAKRELVADLTDPPGSLAASQHRRSAVSSWGSIDRETPADWCTDVHAVNHQLLQ